MYSHGDRTGAVKLYIKLGKRTAATIGQPGYPIKEPLKSWHQEFERRHDLPLGYVRSKGSIRMSRRGWLSTAVSLMIPLLPGPRHLDGPVN